MDHILNVTVQAGGQSSSMFSIAPERLLDTILAKSQNVVNRKVGDYLPLTDCELRRTCLSMVEKDLRYAHKKFVSLTKTENDELVKESKDFRVEIHEI